MFNNTVDSVLAGFVKFIDRLEKVAETHNNAAKDKAELALALKAEAADHQDEAARANKVREKLLNIIS